VIILDAIPVEIHENKLPIIDERACNLTTKPMTIDDRVEIHDCFIRNGRPRVAKYMLLQPRMSFLELIHGCHGGR